MACISSVNYYENSLATATGLRNNDILFWKVLCAMESNLQKLKQANAAKVSTLTRIKHVATNTLAATKQRLLLNIPFQISIPTKLSAEPVHVITVAAGKEFEEYMVCEDNLELMHQRIMNKLGRNAQLAYFDKLGTQKADLLDDILKEYLLSLLRY